MFIKAFVILWIGWLLSLQSVIATGKTTLVLGYVELEKDSRYKEERLYAGIEFKPRGRPWLGAEVALRESRIVGRALGVKFRLEKVSGKNNELNLSNEIYSLPVKFVFQDKTLDEILIQLY